MGQQGGMKLNDLGALTSLLSSNSRVNPSMNGFSSGVGMQQQPTPSGVQTANTLGRLGGSTNISNLPNAMNMQQQTNGGGLGRTNMNVNVNNPQMNKVVGGMIQQNNTSVQMNMMSMNGVGGTQPGGNTSMNMNMNLGGKEPINNQSDQC